MKPRLSIICAVYNAEEYLAACIESIINQSYRDWELILINDGSKDSSLEICYRYAEQDDRLRVYSQENKGQSAAQNVGLGHSRGEFVAFLDSDDTVEPETYEDAVSILDSDKEVDFVQFPWNCLSYEHHWMGRGKNDRSVLGQENMFNAWLFEDKIGWTNWCKVYRKSLFDGVAFKVGILFEDALMTATIISRARGIGYSNKGGYNFFVRSEEKTKWTERHTKDLIVSYGTIIEMLREYSPRFVEARSHFSRILVDSYMRNKKFRDLARPYVRSILISDIWKSSRLSWRAKVKLFAIKYLSCIF